MNNYIYKTDILDMPIYMGDDEEQFANDLRLLSSSEFSLFHDKVNLFTNIINSNPDINRQIHRPKY